MVLAHVIGAESCAIVEGNQLQAALILLGKRIGPVVVLVEYAELHRLERGRHGNLLTFVVGRSVPDVLIGGLRCRASRVPLWEVPVQGSSRRLRWTGRRRLYAVGGARPGNKREEPTSRRIDDLPSMRQTEGRL